MELISHWTVFLGTVTTLVVGLIALAIVLQVLFGSDGKGIPFIGTNVIDNIAKIISTLGSNGLAGLITAAVIYYILTK